MGSRKNWSCGCLGCGGLWLVVVTMTVLAGAAEAGEGPAETALLVVFFGIAPALIPLGIAAILRRRERQSKEPQRRQQFIDEVHTAIISGDGVTAGDIAESLDCPVARVEEALAGLLGSGDFVGYREAKSGRVRAMDPLRMQPGACPACGAPLDENGEEVTCPECGSRVFRPSRGDETG